MRRLAAQDFKSKTELAKDLGRDLSNLNKTLKRLESEGLVEGDDLTTLSEAGTNAVRQLDQLEGGAAAAGGGILHRQIIPDPDQPRKDFSSNDALQALIELKHSIVQDGLLENLVVRPLAGETTSDGLPLFMLIAGERRWTAIGDAIADDLWPADKPVDCSVKDVDEPTARRLALVENLQRRDLKPLEEARALQALAELTGASAAQIGRDLGFTERWAQQRLALLKLPDAMQAQVEAGDLTVEDARQVPGLMAKLPPIKQVELREGKITVAGAKDWLASRPDAIELTTEEELVFLEAALAIARAGKQSWTEATCDYRWRDAVTTRLQERGALAFRRNYSTGYATVGLGHAGQKTIEALTCANWILDKKLILPLVRRAQTRALANPLAGDDMTAAARKVDEMEKAKQYLTTWLNAPYAIDPDVAEQVKRQAERIEQQRLANEKLEQERAERTARRAAAAERALTFAQDIDAVPAGAIAGVLEAMDAKLPWAWHPAGPHGQVGMLIDADGRHVDLNRWSAAPGLLPLIMALMNATGGHQAVFAKPEPEATDEPAQVDLEEAVAAADEGQDEDVELTPALQRLAGVHDQAPAEVAE